LKSIFLSFHESAGCERTKLEILISSNKHSQRGGKPCVKKIEEMEPTQQDLELECDNISFNNKERTPIIKIKSEKYCSNFFNICLNKDISPFCLKHVKLTTIDDEVFERSFKLSRPTEAMEFYEPLFHKSQLQSSEAVSRISCPTYGCPKKQLVAKKLKEQGQQYICMVNSNCDYVARPDPKDPGSGFACFDSFYGRYDLYEYCCDGSIENRNGINGTISEC
jgi:hypothetical protein